MCPLVINPHNITIIMMKVGITSEGPMYYEVHKQAFFIM